MKKLGLACDTHQTRPNGEPHRLDVPYCNLQLRVLPQALPAMASTGAAFVEVSPQAPDHGLAMT